MENILLETGDVKVSAEIRKVESSLNVYSAKKDRKSISTDYYASFMFEKKSNKDASKFVPDSDILIGKVYKETRDGYIIDGKPKSISYNVEEFKIGRAHV